MLSLLIFLLILSLLVLIHEAGHYFAAKFFNVKVEEFGYGFPPRAWAKKIGETVYSINWLPIGGFVKLFGEDEAGGGKITLSKKEQTDDVSRAFFARPAWQKAVIVVAGVVMNILLAVVIYYFYLGFSGFKTEIPLIAPFEFKGVHQEKKTEVIITGVSPDSPAEKAGITPSSLVTAFNGKVVGDTESFLKQIQASKGKEVTISWQAETGGEIKTAKLTPRLNAPKDQGALGVSFFPAEMAVLSYDTPVQKVFSGITYPFNLMSYNLVVIKHLVSISLQEKTAEPISQGLSGPVGIYSVVGTIVDIPDFKERALNLLNLAGLLSMSLAFFNILPIPALDGGRLFFILIELVFRRKVNQQVEAVIHQIGMAVLLLLLVLVTFKDVFQFFL